MRPPLLVDAEKGEGVETQCSTRSAPFARIVATQLVVSFLFFCCIACVSLLSASPEPPADEVLSATTATSGLAHSKELVAHQTTEARRSVDQFADELFGRAIKASHRHSIDLERVMLGKPSPATPVSRTPSENDKQVINFFAGGLAGCISAAVTAPLEMVKTQLQASVMKQASPLEVVQKIWTMDGPRGFYKGLGPTLVGVLPTRAIFFWSYNETKKALSQCLGNGPLSHLASAFSAGVLSNTITSPLWMVKTRFQILADTSKGQKAFKTYNEVMSAIWKEEGFRGFYKGMLASYIGCTEAAIQWMMYEQAKIMADARAEQRRKDGVANADHLQNAEYFVAAAASKALAILAAYPHEVVRTRLRERAQMGIFKYDSFVQALQLITKEEGIRGLYGGMGLHLMRSVPNAAVMFVAYEILQKVLAESYVDQVLPAEAPQHGRGVSVATKIL